MRYDKNHKDETHQRILDTATQLFLKKGIDGVGIATIMKEAGLTNGAFYAHFKSKDVLVTEMLESALEQKEQEIANTSSDPLDYIKFYLSPVHRDQIECGCPVAALLTELVRHSKSTRKVLTHWSERMIDRISVHLKEKLGYSEKTFNTCDVGFGYSNTQNCRRLYSISIYFQVKCRQSEGTISTILTDADLTPVESSNVRWVLKNVQGLSSTDSFGYGQIQAISTQSQRQQRLRLGIGNNFLYMRASDITKVVTPKDWCP